MKCLYFRVTKTGAHLLQTFLNPGLLKSLSKSLTYKTISTKRIPEQNVYIGHSQTCKMLFLRKIVNGFLPSSGKSSILDVWQGSEYYFIFNAISYQKISFKKQFLCVKIILTVHQGHYFRIHKGHYVN